MCFQLRTEGDTNNSELCLGACAREYRSVCFCVCVCVCLCVSACDVTLRQRSSRVGAAVCEQREARRGTDTESLYAGEKPGGEEPAEESTFGRNFTHSASKCWAELRTAQAEKDPAVIMMMSEEDAEQCYYNESIAFFYNRSMKPLAREWDAVSKLVMGLGITVCVFIMLANLLVMVAIYVNRRFHFPIYYLMANLAAADFFAGLAYFYLMFNTGPNTQRLSVSTWLLRQGLIDTSLTASVANLLAIAIERHITVFRMQLHTRMSNRRVVVVIVVIWTLSIVMGAIPSAGWNCICGLDYCSNMAPLYSNSYLVFWAVFNLLTFVVMVTLYAHIFVYVRRRTMRMSRHSSGPRRNRDTMMSLLKTVVIVLGAFILCWTPGLVLLLLDVFCPSCTVLTYEKFFLLLAEFNSAMNPIIYSYRDKEMSATFRQILCCQRQENLNGTVAEGSDRSASSVNHTVLSPGGGSSGGGGGGGAHNQHHQLQHHNEHSVV
uniref:Lysophosphatidic acid receptor 1 n=2 Tax=Gadus morhua TaxID=8049 RepID=A0A8C5BA24_GADMO